MRRLLILLLAGCAPVAGLIDPPLAQLARWQDAPALATTQPVVSPCPDANRACPALHARRAEACMNSAMAARAPRAACPGLAARDDLRCAAEGYAAARRGAENPALAAGQAQALLCLGYLSESRTSRAFGAQALQAAQSAPADLAALLRGRAQILIDGATPP